MPAAVAEMAVARMSAIREADPEGVYGFNPRFGRTFELDAGAVVEGAGGVSEVRRCGVKSLQTFVRGIQASDAASSATSSVREVIFEAATDGTLEHALARVSDETAAAGPSLHRLLDTLHALLHCFRGLARYHAHGVVHRDVKPDNLMLTRTRTRTQTRTRMQTRTPLHDADVVVETGAAAVTAGEEGTHTGDLVAKFIDFDLSASFLAVTAGVENTMSSYTPLGAFVVAFTRSGDSGGVPLAQSVENMKDMFARLVETFPWIPTWLSSPLKVQATALRALRALGIRGKVLGEQKRKAESESAAVAGADASADAGADASAGADAEAGEPRGEAPRDEDASAASLRRATDEAIARAVRGGKLAVADASGILAAMYKDTYALGCMTLAEAYYAHTRLRFGAVSAAKATGISSSPDAAGAAAAAAAATDAAAASPHPSSLASSLSPGPRAAAAPLRIVAKLDLEGLPLAHVHAFEAFAERLAPVSEEVGQLCYDVSSATAWAEDASARLQRIVERIQGMVAAEARAPEETADGVGPAAWARVDDMLLAGGRKRRRVDTRQSASAEGMRTRTRAHTRTRK